MQSLRLSKTERAKGPSGQRPSRHERRARPAVALAALALAGCTQSGVGTFSSTQIVQPQNAFAYPGPGGPAITTILERHYANAIEQQILLATSSRVSGQNMLRIQLYGPVDRSAAGQTRLREGFLPPANVSTEMRQLIPGVRMARSPYYVQNRYGPFGYAVGRSSSGDTCLFGWQRLTSTGATQTLIGNKGSIQIRLRYCDQRLSERQLLQAMYDFAISASFRFRNWNPYGEPNAPDPSLGKPGAPVYPDGADEIAAVAASETRAEPAVRRTTPRRTAGAAATPPIPEPIGPVVPPPPIAGSPPSAATSPRSSAQPAARVPTPSVAVPPPPCDPGDSTCQ